MSARADVTPVDVVHLAKEIYGLTVTDLKELPGFEDRNFLVSCEPSPPIHEDKQTVPDAQQKTSGQYVIKISGSRDKQDDSKLEKQRLIMNFLSCEHFICPKYVKTKSGSWFEWYDRGNGPMRVRMLTYVPGDTLMDHWEVLSARDTLTTLGEFVSKLHLVLERLTQSGDVQVDVDTLNPWRMDNFLCLKDFLDEIQDVKKRQTLSDILKRFQEEVLCKSDSLSSGIIHGDIHDMNIIIHVENGKIRPIHQPAKETDSDRVKNTFGIIDFGDVTFSKYVFEVSMVIRDAIVDVKSMDPIEIAGHFLGGYLKHRLLNCAELDVLFVCILVALCQYGVLGEHEYKLQPDNEYTKLGAEDAWKHLEVLQKMDKLHVIKTWSTLLSSTYDLVL
ncbi:hydroxylysine kinase-like [Mizuhopecten yessoensis]|uniref:Hydroxylysine kinase n=1 Tax=Mizuhopecten yessoensis TaxID=6573 RepID=A0A210Q6U9_MIZYE|nr:hydroxylysine kinase-like [Mizuhopecten yessoensis]OWF44467.1 Hydroxylysine kinase [Mizuhopecten yessoensis]